MSTGAPSIEKAFRQAAESPGLFGGDIDPLELDALRAPDGRLPANVFQLARQGKARGPGRPKGAGNKRNADLAKLIVHQHGDPVMFMASLYALPLDQACEALLAADGTVERQRQLDDMLVTLSARVAGLAKAAQASNASGEEINRLAEACEALEGVARRSQGKPGDLAIKALNVQLAAAKAVAEYVHSKKPVEATVNVKSDGVLVMPGVGGGGFATADAVTREAGELIRSALSSGAIEASDIAGLRLIEGRLVDRNGDDLGDGDPDDDSESEGA